MKTKRRQELKTNDLAAWLDDASKSFSKWGTYVIGVLAVILVGVIIKGYMSNARAEARMTAFADLRKYTSTRVGEMDKTPEELQSSLQSIDELVSSTRDREFRAEALLSKAGLGLQLAQTEVAGPAAASKGGDPKKYLDAARSAFEKIKADYKSSSPIYYGRALYGLFQVETLAFMLDGEQSHRTTGEKYLEELRDNDAFAGTPLQTVAIDRLNALDDIFTTVKFSARPAPSPTPAPLVHVGPTPPLARPQDTDAAQDQGEANDTPEAVTPPADDASGSEPGDASATEDAGGESSDNEPADEEGSSEGDEETPQ